MGPFLEIRWVPFVEIAGTFREIGHLDQGKALCCSPQVFVSGIRQGIFIPVQRLNSQSLPSGISVRPASEQSRFNGLL